MPRDLKVRQLLATAERHTRAHRLARAVRSYRRVLALTHDGDFARELAHARLGDLHLGQDRPGLALPHLLRAQALSRGEPEYALMIGRALLALSRAEEAAAVLFDAVGSTPHAAQALAELARAAASLGDHRTAGTLARHAGARDACWQPTAIAFADA